MCKVFSLFVGMCVIAMGQPSQATLIGHWKFDEVSGTTALDSSGNGYDGVINGSSVTRVTGPPTPGNPGVLGTALSFNAANLNYVNITGTNSAAHPLSLAGIPNYTIAWWLNYTSGSRFINKHDATGSEGYSLRTAGTGTTLLLTQGTAGSPDTGLLLDAGNWHHWALTYNGSSITVYRDGIAGFTTAGGLLTDEATGALMFGALRLANNNVIQHITGSMDDIRIYNHTLSATDVGALMFVPEPGTLSILMMGAGVLVVRRQALRSALGKRDRSKR